MNEIIVYRNPGEAAFWNLITTSPNAFPVIAGIVVFFVTLTVINSKSPFTNKKDYVNLIFAAFIGGLVMVFLRS